MWRATVLLLAIVCCLGGAEAQPQGTCFPDLPTALKQLNLIHTTALLPIGNLSKPVLDESIPLTLFAPIDDAWVQRSAQLKMDPAAIATTANGTTLSYILQQHVVEGAAVDYTIPEAQAFPLSTDLSVSPCVAASPVPIKVTSTPLGLLVQSEGTSALVTASHTTCGGISAIYVIDDVLNPCPTEMFDINQSPLLKPIFYPTDPLISQFVDFFQANLFDVASNTWTLPPTLFVPSPKALSAFLTNMNADPDMDNVTRNSVYKALTAMHQSQTPVTKESLLLKAPKVKIPSGLFGKIKEPTCETSVTVALRSPSAAEAGAAVPFLGTVSVGTVKANILKSYKMINGTTLYIIDQVLVPCDLTKLGPCKQFTDIQKKPLVAAAFASKDPDVKLFMNYFTKPLFVNDTWTLPSSLFMPSTDAVNAYVASIKADSTLAEGVEEILGNTTLYHMTNTVITNDTLAAGPAVGTTLLYGSSKQACEKTVTVTRKAGVTTVTAGTTTATVLVDYTLCENNTVFVIDKVLQPCNLTSFVPCTQFYQIQSTPELAPLFSATDTNLKTFMNYFNSPLYNAKLKTWVLPNTVFFVSGAALQPILAKNVGKDINSEKAKKLYAILTYVHTSDTPISLDELIAVGSAGMNITTNLVNGTTKACQNTVTATSVKTSPSNYQVTLALGDSTANVISHWSLCGNKNVFLLDAPLVPCDLASLVSTYKAPKDFGKSSAASPRTLPTAAATVAAAGLGALAMLAL